MVYQYNGRNITFVAGLHGNEYMPVMALEETKQDFVLGNPRALDLNVRFTEQDLNASFGFENSSYESKRAAEILEEIPQEDVVVDFHTTSSTQEPFAIVVDENMIPLAKRTGVQHIVIMKHDIKAGHALISHRDGISVEVGIHNSLKSNMNTLEIALMVLSPKEYPAFIYEAYGEISKPGKYVNFSLCDKGFIPILTNEEKAIPDFYGLKAKIIS